MVRHDKDAAPRTRQTRHAARGAIVCAMVAPLFMPFEEDFTELLGVLKLAELPGSRKKAIVKLA
jgi:hypothetical protein